MFLSMYVGAVPVPQWLALLSFASLSLLFTFSSTAQFAKDGQSGAPGKSDTAFKLKGQEAEEQSFLPVKYTKWLVMGNAAPEITLWPEWVDQLLENLARVPRGAINASTQANPSGKWT